MMHGAQKKNVEISMTTKHKMLWEPASYILKRDQSHTAMAKDLLEEILSPCAQH